MSYRLPLVAVFALQLLACSHAAVNLSQADKAVDANDYSTMLDHWTRSKRVYENVESRLFINATLMSWEFRQAQIAYKAKRESLHKDDVKELTTGQRKEVGQWLEFFVAAHTHEWYWNRLENRSKDALWRIRLINNNGVAVAPVRIQRLGTDDPNYRVLYPYFRDFYVGYKIRFPYKNKAGQQILGKGVSKLTLRVGGSPAVINLDWSLTP